MYKRQTDLIVGVTSEDFDINRGKLNVQQSLMERIKNVKESGYADEIKMCIRDRDIRKFESKNYSKI